MIRLAAKLLAVLIVVQTVARVTSQPIPRTQWEQISATPITPDPPRVATFSDDSYIVVYVVDGANSDSAVGVIFGTDGAVLVPEFLVPDSSATSNVAPRVLIFSDDTFLTVWRDAEFNEIRAKYWHRNGTALATQFRISTSESPSTLSDSFEVALLPNDGWFCAYAESGASLSVFWFNAKQTQPTLARVFDALQDTHLTLAANYFDSQIYMFHEGTAETLSFHQLPFNPDGDVQYSVPSILGATPSRPFTTVMSSGLVPVFWHSTLEEGNIPSSIGLNVFRPGGSQMNFTVVNAAVEGTFTFFPKAIDLGNDRLLVVYQSTFADTARHAYRTVLVSDRRVAPLGPETIDGGLIMNPFLSTTVGSDIIVVAINRNDLTLVRRVLTFCGNSAIELREQCDGTEFCTQSCVCEQGFVSVNGRCVPDCGDGVVVGSEQCDSSTDSSCDNSKCVCAAGYIPTVPRQNGCTLQPSTFRPSVGPTLDCISPGESPIGFFSFLNEDGFAQTIPFGELNQFIPNTLGVNRPTQFEAGASLTFPSAPFRLDLTGEIQSFTWILGQFNLTVDLSNISALYCPADVSFVIRLLTSDVLTEELVQVLLNNIARRFGIPSSRLTATVVLNNPPAEGRRAIQQAQLFLFDYTVKITVKPVETSEPSSEDVVDNFLTEYKNTTLQEEINKDLTEGLESTNPLVKEITPAPTGVSVRSEQFEVPAPVAVFTPKATSSASVMTVKCHSLIFLLVLALVEMM